MVLHLAGRLVARFDPVDGFAGRTLQTAVLVAVVVHGHKALEVVLVTALCQAAHRLSPEDAAHAGTLVAGRSHEGLHADGTVLTRTGKIDTFSSTFVFYWFVPHIMDEINNISFLSCCFVVLNS